MAYWSVVMLCCSWSIAVIAVKTIFINRKGDIDNSINATGVSPSCKS